MKRLSSSAGLGKNNRQLNNHIQLSSLVSQVYYIYSMILIIKMFQIEMLLDGDEESAEEGCSWG